MLKAMDRRKRAEELAGPKWAEWYFLTPQERWRESEKLWAAYLAAGGSLDPDPDPDDPFYDPDEWRALSDGKPILKVTWRGGVQCPANRRG